MCEVTLEIYDLYGRKVDEVISGTYTAGEYTVAWKPSGSVPGTWYMKLTAGERQVYKRIIRTD
jgi:hypothetical protein